MPSYATAPAKPRFASLPIVTRQLARGVRRNGGHDDALSELRCQIYAVAAYAVEHVGITVPINIALKKHGGSLGHHQCLRLEEFLEQAVLDCTTGPEEEGAVLLAVYDALLGATKPLSTEECAEVGRVEGKREDHKRQRGPDPTVDEWEHARHLTEREMAFGVKLRR